MKKEIFVPAAGESVTEADIAAWYKSDGDYVEMDEPIVSLETDKASLDLTAEVSGTLNILVAEGETVNVGDPIGTIDTSAEAPKIAPKAEVKEESNVTPASTSTPTENSYAKGHPSPAAAKAAANGGISLDTIQGSGRDGRITKDDVLSQGKSPEEKSKIVSESSHGERTQQRKKMSRIRKTIMNRLVQTQQTGALLTTFNEVDMSAVMDIRKKYKDSFKDKHEVGLGFMSFFTKAVCSALKEYPIINAQVDGEEIVYHDYCDVGIAVSTPKGLVVPVVRNAETLNFVQIEKTILDYALRGRAGELTLDDMSGGTFTITNGGVFGSMLSTPIINYPQSAILGMHNIVKRPVAVGDEVKIRPIMYVALTYDHRIIDGAEAVRFLVHIKDQIEDPTRMLIDL